MTIFRDEAADRHAWQDSLRLAIHDLANLFTQIDTAAEDGQDGSADYAMDRLRLIRNLATAGQTKLDRVREALAALRSRS